MENKVLVILGMHRSGTSLTAQWLHACGLNLGDRFLGSDFSNLKGHYEDLDFLEVHKLILKYNNLKDSGLEGKISELTLNKYLKEKLKYNVLLKNNLNNQWGWKEPRTCLFINEYKKIIPNVKFLIVYRDLAKVRTSLIKRETTHLINDIYYSTTLKKLKFSILKNYYLNKWTRIFNDKYVKANIYYHSQIINFINNRNNRNNFLLFNIDNLENKSQEVLDTLSHWGFKLNKTDFSNIYETKLIDQRSKYLKPFLSMTPKEKELYETLNKYAI